MKDPPPEAWQEPRFSWRCSLELLCVWRSTAGTHHTVVLRKTSHVQLPEIDSTEAACVVRQQSACAVIPSTVEAFFYTFRYTGGVYKYKETRVVVDVGGLLDGLLPSSSERHFRILV